MDSILEIKNLKKSYYVKKSFNSRNNIVFNAVDNVSFRIDKGENLSLVGESGCGKTTLARAILKVIPFDSGKVLFKDKDITKFSKDNLLNFRKNIQMVFQDPYSSLDPRFTLRKILEEAMVLQKNNFPDKSSKETKMKEVLSAVNLSYDILGRYPHEFSGGERQRIAIARALVVDPELLILDEAVSSLDVLIQKQIINLFLNLQKKFNITYLFISHNLKVAKKISQKIAVMYRGKIVELGTSSEIFNNPLHRYTQELLSAAVDYKVLRKSSDVEIPPGSEFVEKCNGHWVLI